MLKSVRSTNMISSPGIRRVRWICELNWPWTPKTRKLESTNPRTRPHRVSSLLCQRLCCYSVDGPRLARRTPLLSVPILEILPSKNTYFSATTKKRSPFLPEVGPSIWHLLENYVMRMKRLFDISFSIDTSWISQQFLQFLAKRLDSLSFFPRIEVWD